MKKILFIGTGRMATAIAGGMVKSQVANPTEIIGFDVNSKACADFTAATGVVAVDAMEQVNIEEIENVILAVKPQMLVEAMKSWQELICSKVILSIVAGVPLARLHELTRSTRIIRVMPNTPALVKAGAAGYALSNGCSQAEEDLAIRILSSVGVALRVSESDLDAVTALSGSGPAYVFEFIQALADGGVAEGLSRQTAQTLAVQTVLGAAKMVLDTGIHPTVLKDQVTSPAGTTSRALEVLDSQSFTGIVIRAVRAAAVRSRELGKI